MAIEARMAAIPNVITSSISEKPSQRRPASRSGLHEDRRVLLMVDILEGAR
jgi:hypothetical protein